MPKIYLSPSTQEYNPYVTGNGSEEYFMNLVANLVSFFTEREDLSLAESERVIRLAEEAIRKRKDAGK